MAAITVSGLGSGLDVNSIVEQVVTAEGAPKTRRLDLKEAQYQAQLSSLGTLKSALSSFQTTLGKMASTSAFNARTATSSNESLLSVTASSIADSGDYTIDVRQLARAHSLASGTFEELTDTVGTGTLTISFGTTDYTPADPDADPPVEGSYSFTENTDKEAFVLELDESNNSLQAVRDAINDADNGLSASVINDGAGYRLVVTSRETGAESSLQITVADDDGVNDDESGLSQLAFNGDAIHMTQTQAAQDAQFTINGLAVTRSTNTVGDAIKGLTLNLKSADAGNPVNISVGENRNQARTLIENFVTSFNELTASLKSMSSYNAETGQAGVLLGDSVVRSVSSLIRKELSEALPSGSYRTLAGIGITTQRDGTLSVNDSKLSAAFEEDFDAVVALFADSGSSSDSLISYAGSSNSTQVGRYAVNITQLPGDGVDVAGTIGGYPATGNGSLLTGTGAASGLVIDVQGGELGDRGSITFTRGLAGRLDTLIESFLSDEGSLTARTSGLEDRIKGIGTERERLATYLEGLEARYRAQFTALDVMMSQMQKTSEYLTQQIDNLPTIGKSK